MPYTAALFDLDGTLLDTLGDIATASNAALAELNLPPYPADAYRMMVGEGAEVLAQRVLPADRLDFTPAYLEAYHRLYALHAYDRTAPYPGIRPMLDGLVAAGVRIAVLSNKLHASTQKVVAHYFPGLPWAAVLGQRADVPRKPDPAGALEIARSLGIAPAQALFVGDTKIDMLTATGAGMTPVGVLWGFRDRQELESHGAKHLIAQPAELLKWIH